MSIKNNKNFRSFQSVTVYTDEEIISKKKVKDLQIEDYCVKTKKGWKIAFVGFIIRQDFLIISFPKKYIKDTENIKEEDISLLTKLFSKLVTNSPTNWDKQDVENSYPLKAYLDICNYFTRNGFHFNEMKKLKYGYGGKINWEKTIKHSPNYVQENQVHYLPFVVTDKSRMETLITNAMKYVLADGYGRVGKNFNVGVPYYDSIIQRSISYNAILIQLKQLKVSTFNDMELKLINSLILYFEWVTGNHKETVLVTLYFDTTWEKIVNEYVNENINRILKLSDYTKDIEFNGDLLEDLRKKLDIEQDNRDDRFIVYDYLVRDDNYVLLFDSKYYLDLDKDLDYKQFSYHYFIKLHEKVSKNHHIINALIAPTESKSNSQVHIDLTPFDDNPLFAGVRILIFNLNTKDVVQNYVN